MIKKINKCYCSKEPHLLKNGKSFILLCSVCNHSVSNTNKERLVTNWNKFIEEKK